MRFRVNRISNIFKNTIGGCIGCHDIGRVQGIAELHIKNRLYQDYIGTICCVNKLLRINLAIC